MVSFMSIAWSRPIAIACTLWLLVYPYDSTRYCCEAQLDVVRARGMLPGFAMAAQRIPLTSHLDSDKKNKRYLDEKQHSLS